MSDWPDISEAVITDHGNDEEDDGDRDGNEDDADDDEVFWGD